MQHFAARLIFLTLSCDHVTPLLKNPNGSSLPIKRSPISLASYLGPSIILPQASSPTLSRTSSPYTPFVPGKACSLMLPQNILYFSPLYLSLCCSLCLEYLSWHMSHTAHPSSICMWRHLVINSGDYSIYTHALDPSSHRILTMKGNDLLLWSKDAGAGAPGVVSPIHCASRYPKAISYTEQNVICMNQCQYTVAIIVF